MKVLIDTSIWIEYFRPKPKLSEASLGFVDLLLMDYRATTIYPIQTELFSGHMRHSKHTILRDAFSAMEHIDLDWNHPETWQALADLAQEARKKSLPTLGLVDRMILVSTQQHEAQLWTLDRGLKKSAKALGVGVF